MRKSLFIFRLFLITGLAFASGTKASIMFGQPFLKTAFIPMILNATLNALKQWQCIRLTEWYSDFIANDEKTKTAYVVTELSGKDAEKILSEEGFSAEED